MKVSGVLTIVLLAAFLWLAYRGNLFPIIHTWDATTWAIMVLSGLLGWVLRNEFGGL